MRQLTIAELNQLLERAKTLFSTDIYEFKKFILRAQDIEVLCEETLDNIPSHLRKYKTTLGDAIADYGLFVRAHENGNTHSVLSVFVSESTMLPFE